MERLSAKFYRYFVQPVFNGIGYFFGFSIVVIFSIGLILPGPFDELFQRRTQRPSWKLVYHEHQKVFLAPEVVVSIGWLGLAAVTTICLASLL